jgi:WD40 repeat protein
MSEAAIVKGAIVARTRPFPGLRSFRQEEAQIFFGRDGQCDEILRQCGRSRFVAVVGTSGSGKSSLVRAGLLPLLHAGYFVQAGSKWQIVDFRPGGNPIANLWSALPTEVQDEQSESCLRTSSSGLTEIIQAAREAHRLDADENVLIFVDQFEELIRYQTNRDPTNDQDEKMHFVRSLIECAKSRDKRIVVVLTIRADYLGDCVQFRDLPEHINRGQFLVPRMSRQQIQAAIEGPIRIAGGQIAPRLTQRVLNELSDEADQLPVLQHALMRTWEAWLNCKKPHPLVDFEDYEEIGGLENALSDDADDTLKKACKAARVDRDQVKYIFQRLRERDAKRREVRRPTSVKDLKGVTGWPLQTLTTVLDVFRNDEEGCTFLSPLKTDLKQLAEETQVDVTHEALLRRWRKLRDEWVPEEEESGKIYTELASRAEKEEKAEEKDYIKGTSLDTVLEWWRRRNPNEAWAYRYHHGYAAAQAFLIESANQEAFEGIEKRKRLQEEASQKWRYRALWVTLAAAILIVVGAGATISYLMTVRKGNIANLLASQSALVSKENDALLPVSMLLAVDSIKLKFNLPAQSLVSQALNLIPLPDHRISVSDATKIAFSADGKLIVLDKAGTLTEWNATSGKKEGVFPTGSGAQHDGSAEVLDFAVAQDGDSGLVIAATAGQQIEVFTSQMRELQRVQNKGPISMLAADGDGHVVAALSGGEVVLWRFRKNWSAARSTHFRPRLQENFRHINEVRWDFVALSQPGDRIALGHRRSGEEFFVLGDSLVIVGNTDTSLPVATISLSSHLTGLSFHDAADFLADTQDLLTADANGSVRTWALPAIRETKKTTYKSKDLDENSGLPLFRASDRISALDTRSDEPVAIGCRNGLVRVWEGDKEVVRTVAERSISSVAYSSTLNLLASVDDQGFLGLWNTADLGGGERVAEGIWLNASFVPGSPYVVCRLNSSFLVFDVNKKGAEPQIRLNRLMGASKDRVDVVAYSLMAISKDLKLVAVYDRPMGSDPHVDVVRIENGILGAPLWHSAPLLGPTGGSQFSPDGTKLATFMFKNTFAYVGELVVWNAKTGIQLCLVPAAARGFKFTPDSEKILFPSQDTGLRVLDVRSCVVTESFPSQNQEITAITVSPDGRLLAIGWIRDTEKKSDTDNSFDNSGSASSGVIDVWDYSSRKRLHSYPQGNEVRRITFSPNSRLLAIAVADSTIRIIDVATGEPKYQSSLGSAFFDLSFVSEYEIAIATRNLIAIRSWDPSALIDQACHRVSRNLTKEQWQRYSAGAPYQTSCATLP